MFYTPVYGDLLQQHQETDIDTAQIKPVTSIVLNQPWPAISDILFQVKVQTKRDFSGGPGVKALPFNAGVVGSIPGWRTKIPHDFKKFGVRPDFKKKNSIQRSCSGSVLVISVKVLTATGPLQQDSLHKHGPRGYDMQFWFTESA